MTTDLQTALPTLRVRCFHDNFAGGFSVLDLDIPAKSEYDHVSLNTRPYGTEIVVFGPRDPLPWLCQMRADLNAAIQRIVSARNGEQESPDDDAA